MIISFQNACASSLSTSKDLKLISCEYAVTFSGPHVYFAFVAVGKGFEPIPAGAIASVPAVRAAAIADEGFSLGLVLGDGGFPSLDLFLDRLHLAAQDRGLVEGRARPQQPPRHHRRHPDRQAEFQKKFGKPMQGSTLEEQMAFMHYELTQGNERKAGNILRGTTGAAEAAAADPDRGVVVAAQAAGGAVGELEGPAG